MEDYSSEDDYISDILSSSDESDYISDIDSEDFDKKSKNSETDYESESDYELESDNYYGYEDINFNEFKRLLDILHIDYLYEKNKINNTIEYYNLII